MLWLQEGLGLQLGLLLWLQLGLLLWLQLGLLLGLQLGLLLGLQLGLLLGLQVGLLLGLQLGLGLGLQLGEGDQLGDPDGDGDQLGDPEGEGDQLGDPDVPGLLLPLPLHRPHVLAQKLPADIHDWLQALKPFCTQIAHKVPQKLGPYYVPLCNPDCTFPWHQELILQSQLPDVSLDPCCP